MPSRCSTLKGKASSRLICKSLLPSVWFFFPKGSGDKGAGVGSMWVAAQALLCPELSTLRQCPPRSQEAMALPSSASSWCPLSGPQCPHFCVEVYRERGVTREGLPSSEGG